MFYFYWTLDSNLPTCSETSLGHIDHVAIEKELDGSLKKRESYVKYTPEDRYKIGKYGSENGPAAAVRKFKSRFPKLNESTVRSLRQKYQYELTRSKQKDTILEPRIPREPTKGPLLLGNKIDAMVQKYIIASGNCGNVISRLIATSTAKALISRNPGYVGQIDLESSSGHKVCFVEWASFIEEGPRPNWKYQMGPLMRHSCCSLTILCLRWINTTSEIPWSST